MYNTSLVTVSHTQYTVHCSWFWNPYLKGPVWFQSDKKVFENIQWNSCQDFFHGLFVYVFLQKFPNPFKYLKPFYFQTWKKSFTIFFTKFQTFIFSNLFQKFSILWRLIRAQISGYAYLIDSSYSLFRQTRKHTAMYSPRKYTFPWAWNFYYKKSIHPENRRFVCLHNKYAYNECAFIEYDKRSDKAIINFFYLRS